MCTQKPESIIFFTKLQLSIQLSHHNYMLHLSLGYKKQQQKKTRYGCSAPFGSLILLIDKTHDSDIQTYQTTHRPQLKFTKVLTTTTRTSPLQRIRGTIHQVRKRIVMNAHLVFIVCVFELAKRHLLDRGKYWFCGLLTISILQFLFLSQPHPFVAYQQYSYDYQQTCT